jgi:hypothetical protein
VASRLSPRRIAGFAALAFAVIVGFVNLFVGSLGAPLADASGQEVITFVSDNTGALTFAIGLVPLGVLALFAFLAAVYPVLGRTSPEAAFWTRLGAAGIILVEVMFLVRTLFEVALVANIDALSSDPLLVETIWRLQGAGLILTGLGLAVTLTGLSRAARLGGLIPSWQQGLGFGAAAGFLVQGFASVAALEGSPIALVGLVAFVGWLTWLAMTGVRLLRSSDQPA